MKSPDPRALLESLELQHQALSVALARLAALEQPRRVVVAPIEKRRRYSRPAPLPATAAPGAWWPREEVKAAPLRPGPGLPACSLAGQPLPVVLYDLCGLDEAGIESAVVAVENAQRSLRSFAPVFLTDNPAFGSFRKRRYSFEYLPAAAKLAPQRVGAADHGADFARFVEAKWAPAHRVRLGTAAFGALAQESAGLEVVAFPDYSAKNPYQRLAYAGLGSASLRYAPLSQAVAQAAEGRPTLFHLHWEDALYRNLRREAWPAAQAAVLAELDLLKRHGGRFLWTVHNLEPHDLDGAAAKRFMTGLAERADAIHLHSDWCARQAIEHFGADASKLHVVAHPSYHGLYPAGPDRASARAALNLPAEGRVVLMFGNMRGYKGFEEAVEALVASDANLHLVIAGRAGPYDPVADVAHPRITILKGYVEDDDVARLFAAADFALFPYRRISTSGALLLSLTYGVPVIAPRIPALADLLQDGREGLVFDPADPAGLTRALGEAAVLPEAKRLAMGRAALARALAHPPAAFSGAMARLIEGFAPASAKPVAAPVQAPAKGERPAAERPAKAARTRRRRAA